MGFLINEKDFINENVFKFEERLESQYTIFLDKSPTFVNYYHINNVNSTADNGIGHIDQFIGKDSPLRYQKISDFPIYGIEDIKLDLGEEDEGLTTSFEADGVILPNTVKPLPDDFFVITYLNKNYLFRVISIDYDTIKSNNFYKIVFSLHSVDDTAEKLENQVIIKYRCIFDNIGTDEKCIIQEDAITLISTIEKIYEKIASTYKRLYYNKKYNSFIYKHDNHMLYDKYLTHFINTSRVFNEKDSFSTLYLANEDFGELFDIEYGNTFYKALEDKRKDDLTYTGYIESPITYQQSVFLHYNTDDVKSVRFTPCNLTIPYISNSCIDNIIANNSDDVSLPLFEKMIVKYFNDVYANIYNLEVDDLAKYKFEYSRQEFIYVPVILYILRYYVNQFIHV